MKKILATLLFLCILAVACRKNFFGTGEEAADSHQLTIAMAKDHFKSIDPQLAAVHSDLADANSAELIWSQAIEGKNKLRGDFVEVPIAAKRKRIALYNFTQDSLKSAPDELVCDFVVQRMLFFKDKKGETNQRIVTYIPDKEYAVRRKTEVYLNSVKKLQSDFCGYIEYKTIDNTVTKLLRIKNGRVARRFARGKLISNSAGTASRSVMTTAEGINCTTTCVDIYDWDCQNHWEEGVLVAVCRKIRIDVECTEECPPDPDPDPDPHPDPDPDPPNPEYYDCAGVLNGSAYPGSGPNCPCIGGTTGITECACPEIEPIVSLTQVPYTGGFPPGREWGATGIPSGDPYSNPTIQFTIDACRVGNKWKAILTQINGKYYQGVRLYPGVIEVSADATSESNYCTKVFNLSTFGGFVSGTPPTYYMLAAVQAHEDVHKAHLQPLLQNRVQNAKSLVNNIEVPYTNQTKVAAIAQIKSLTAFVSAQNDIHTLWRDDYEPKEGIDHGIGSTGQAYIAEKEITKPVGNGYCSTAVIQNWSACQYCPIN